jgi:prephenate dehydratase
MDRGRKRKAEDQVIFYFFFLRTHGRSHIPRLHPQGEAAEKKPAGEPKPCATNIIFRKKSAVGALQSALLVFKVEKKKNKKKEASEQISLTSFPPRFFFSLLQEHNVDLTHIESRPARVGDNQASLYFGCRCHALIVALFVCAQYEFFVSMTATSEHVAEVIKALEAQSTFVQVQTAACQAHENEIFDGLFVCFFVCFFLFFL